MNLLKKSVEHLETISVELLQEVSMGLPQEFIEDVSVILLKILLVELLKFSVS